MKKIFVGVLVGLLWCPVAGAQSAPAATSAAAKPAADVYSSLRAVIGAFVKAYENYGFGEEKAKLTDWDNMPPAGQIDALKKFLENADNVEKIKAQLQTEKEKRELDARQAAFNGKISALTGKHLQTFKDWLAKPENAGLSGADEEITRLVDLCKAEQADNSNEENRGEGVEIDDKADPCGEMKNQADELLAAARGRAEQTRQQGLAGLKDKYLGIIRAHVTANPINAANVFDRQKVAATVDFMKDDVVTKCYEEMSGLLAAGTPQAEGAEEVDYCADAIKEVHDNVIMKILDTMRADPAVTAFLRAAEQGGAEQ